MADSEHDAVRQILEAVAFAARAHQGQLRKDGRTPYVSHVFRVCFVVRHVFGIADPRVLTATVLHDTIEDTTTDFDDVEDRFGADVAEMVGALSKDTRRRDDDRENEYVATLAAASWQVQVCKLGDVYDNLLDSSHMPAEKRARTLARSRRYLDALGANLRAEAQSAFAIVDRLHREMVSTS